MEQASDPAPCPVCGQFMKRIYSAVPDIWNTEGSHRGDYGSGLGRGGTKADILRRNYKQQYGEEAPPPATDVPRNHKEKW